ncbi:MAG: hypothetical protein KDA60_09135, partial [Planctomycetales bacterium]|nr:hypothetical protein [Planctomycetales bacterium]
DEHALIQRSRAFAIVDEVDNVLIDDASSPLVLSGQTGQTAPDAIAHELACLLATTLVEGVDFRLSGTQRTIELTPGGMERIHAADVAIPVDALRRSWAEYVEQSLRARWLFRRDVHYVVDGDEVKIVDASTGRIFSDRTWSDGLHQAVEARERLRITAERVVLAQITRQRFYRLYGRLAGMTGTATGCEREFRSVYDLQIHPIPLRRPSQREVWETRLFADRLAKWEAIASEVERLHDQGRPILVGTRSIAESETLAALIEERGLSLQLLNGRQDAAEAAIVAAAGDSGAITIATNLAGRGTDIALDKRSLAAGGLHVIVAEPHESPRVDRQLIGRSARQGDPGSAQVFVAAQDELIQRAAPWLERPLRRGANSTGEIRMKLGNRLLKAQQALERAQAAQRQALLRRDLARDSILGQLL